MKTKAAICIAVICVAVTLGCWLSHRNGGSFANRTLSVAPPPFEAGTVAPNPQSQQSSPPREVPPGQTESWEYLTVEEEMSEADLRQHMQEWAREGWAVLSVSKPLPQSDGTIHRKAELKRARK